MRSFLIHASCGPLVLTQRDRDWVVSSPGLATEIVVDSVPPVCLLDAVGISAAEADRVRAGGALPLER